MKLSFEFQIVSVKCSLDLREFDFVKSHERRVKLRFFFIKILISNDHKKLRGYSCRIKEHGNDPRALNLLHFAQMPLHITVHGMPVRIPLHVAV